MKLRPHATQALCATILRVLLTGGLVAITEISNETYDYNVDALRIMIYGPPGSGKTWFIGTMPDVYIIALDPGLIGLQLAEKKFKGVMVDTYDELLQVVDEIINGKRGQTAKSFALDHLGEVTTLSAVKRDLRNQPNKLKQSTWGAISDDVRMAMRKFLDIASVRRVPVCVAAHQRIDKNELTKDIIGSPDTVGKFSQQVGGLFDVFLYSLQQIEWKEGQQVPRWFVSTVDHLEFRAKDRTGQLLLEEPNDYQTLYAKIKARADEIKEKQNA